MIMKLDIIKETNDYLVINKPAGLIVHPAPGITDKTLVDFLLEKYPEIEKVGDDPLRPGIMHRLDKDVNGLMVIAKTNESFESLKDQFKNRKIEKEYTTLVFGNIPKESGIIDFVIKRSSSGHRMAAIPTVKREESNNPRERGNIVAREKAKIAITTFKIVKEFINYTLLKVQIKTGRTHQIRVHMFAYGHPILGDKLYNTKKTKLKNEKLKMERIFLVADKLSFIDLEGEKQEFSIELPTDLQEILEKVK